MSKEGGYEKEPFSLVPEVALIIQIIIARG
jgi:hypothetical protein